VNMGLSQRPVAPVGFPSSFLEADRRVGTAQAGRIARVGSGERYLWPIAPW
jgi:hypothetical protein